jgi:LuxR family transcriptional regulator, regulator of acetate metabolism
MRLEEGMAMAVQLAPATPYTADGLARVLASFRSAGRMDMAFGGRVLADSRKLEISALCGARTRSLANLVVRPGAGLGGKSLLLGRPVSVTSYQSAEGITHVYDHAVSQESLETVVALPIVVDNVPRMVLYLGNRSKVRLGDRWFDRFAPLVRKLERDIAVDDEIRRRLRDADDARSAAGSLTPSDLRELSDELAAVAAEVDDAALRARLHQLCARLTPSTAPSSAQPRIALARREVDVLNQVSLGRSNREAAEELGLLPNTVKSYLKTAMRKLEANNRVQAITAARKAGLIR